MYPTRFTHSNWETAENRSTPVDLHAEPFDLTLNLFSYFKLESIEKCQYVNFILELLTVILKFELYSQIWEKKFHLKFFSL